MLPILPPSLGNTPADPPAGSNPEWIEALRKLLSDLRVMATAPAKRQRLAEHLKKYRLPMNVLTADDRVQAIWLLRTQQAELVIGVQKELGLNTETELLAARNEAFDPIRHVMNLLKSRSPTDATPPVDDSASDRN